MGSPYLYLVARGITKTWEQREELPSRCCAGVFLEDNDFQLRGRGDLALVAHQALRDCVDLTCCQLVAQPDTNFEGNGGVISYGMENRQLGDSGGSCKFISGSVTARRSHRNLPDPNNLAAVLSFLTFFAELEETGIGDIIFYISFLSFCLPCFLPS